MFKGQRKALLTVVRSSAFRQRLSLKTESWYQTHDKTRSQHQPQSRWIDIFLHRRFEAPPNCRRITQLATMNSQNNPSKVLIWNRTNNEFKLADPNNSAVTCIGFYSPSRRRCSNKIASRRIAIAQSITKGFLRPDPSVHSMPYMLFSLAKATLCQKCCQDQAQELSDRWFDSIDDWWFPAQWYTPSGTQLNAGFSGVSESGSDQDRPEVTGHENAGRRGGGGGRGEYRQQAGPGRQRAPRDNNDPARSGRGRGGRTRNRSRHDQARPEAEERTQPQQPRHAAAKEQSCEIPEETVSKAEEERQSGQQEETYCEEDKREARQLLQEDEHRRGQQTRARVRPELRAAHKARLAQEDKARFAEEAQTRLEAELRRAID
jgi:hypothetical protein